MEKGRIRIYEKNNPARGFECWLGGDSPNPSDGYGGWEVVPRPRRAGATQWNGRAPYQMDIQLVMDGFAPVQEVEIECRALEQMSLGLGGNEPPVVMIESEFVPHTDLPWVIGNLEWGAAIRRNTNGRRVRQEVTITLVQYIAADKVQ